MPSETATTGKSRKPSTLGALLTLLGFFMLFCATLMCLAGAWRTYKEYSRSHWIEIPATVKKCSLNINHPFSSDGGGTTFSLRCTLDYDFDAHPYESVLQTTSTYSEQIRSDIEDWVEQHRSGAIVPLRVNPSHPVEIAAAAHLPIEQFNTANEAWVTALFFGVPGLLFVAIGRILTRPTEA